MVNIDPKSGALLLPFHCIEQITPGTELNELENQFFGWEKTTWPDGRSSFRIELQSRQEYETHHLLLWFCESRLSSIKIFITADSIGDSSSRWSKAKEIRRKKLHESMFCSALGKHKWGAVRSVYDAEERQSYVLLDYAN